MPGVTQQILREEPAARVKRLMPDTKQLQINLNGWKNEFWEAKRQVDLQFAVPADCSDKNCAETSAMLDVTLEEALRAGQYQIKYFRQS
jgi:hypothetical protein